MTRRCALVLALVAASCRAEVPAEAVRAWLSQWETVRACLVPIAGPDTFTSLSIAKLVTPKADPCLLMLVDVAIQPAERPGQVGAHWERAIEATKALLHSHPSPAGRAAYLDAVGREVAWLAPRVGYEVGHRAPPQPLAPLPPRTVIEVDGAPLVGYSPFLGMPNGVLTGTRRPGPSMLRFLVDAPDLVRTWTLPEAGLVGYPSMSWQVTAAEFVDRGVAQPELLVAADVGSRRVVVLHDLARWAGAGIFAVATGQGWTTEAVSDLTLDIVQDPRTGITDVLERDPVSRASYVRRLEVQEDHLAHRIPSPVPLTHVVCAESGRTWYETDEGIARFDGRMVWSLPTGEGSEGHIVACRRDTALIFAIYPDRVVRCRDDACEPPVVLGRGKGTAALLDDGAWIYAAVVNDVVGIWREGATAPTFHRFVETDTALFSITVLRGTPYLVTRDRAGVFGLVAIP